MPRQTCCSRAAWRAARCTVQPRGCSAPILMPSALHAACLPAGAGLPGAGAPALHAAGGHMLRARCRLGLCYASIYTAPASPTATAPPCPAPPRCAQEFQGRTWLQAAVQVRVLHLPRCISQLRWMGCMPGRSDAAPCPFRGGAWPPCGAPAPQHTHAHAQAATHARRPPSTLHMSTVVLLLPLTACMCAAPARGPLPPSAAGGCLHHAAEGDCGLWRPGGGDAVRHGEAPLGMSCMLRATCSCTWLRSVPQRPAQRAPARAWCTRVARRRPSHQCSRRCKCIPPSVPPLPLLAPCCAAGEVCCVRRDGAHLAAAGP